MINRNPIYQQLNQLLRELIRNGEFGIGDKFLTERTIGERYRVSRATANKAISNLVSEGVLEFRKGVGTFVRRLPHTDEFRSITGFTENVRNAGMEPATRVLRFESLEAAAADRDLPELLRVPPEERLFRVERLRLADETPMMFEQRFIVARYCPGLEEGSLSGSIYDLFQGRYGLTISGADERIRATIIDARASELLGIEEGLAAFKVSSIGYIDEDIPLWWEETIHRPAAFEFRCRVRPRDGSRSIQERLLLDHSPRT